MQQRRGRLLVVFILLMAVLSFIFWCSRRDLAMLWQREKPLKTVVRMRDLLGILYSEEPDDTSSAAVQQLCTTKGRADWARDGWRNAFIVEMSRASGGERVYRITSLGSDGKRGSCCTRFVSSFEDDAVLEGEEWLQQWTFGREVLSR
jgi:hypothetical protein